MPPPVCGNGDPSAARACRRRRWRRAAMSSAGPPIASATTLAQLAELVAATRIALSPEDRAELDRSSVQADAVDSRRRRGCVIDS